MTSTAAGAAPACAAADDVDRGRSGEVTGTASRRRDDDSEQSAGARPETSRPHEEAPAERAVVLRVVLRAASRLWACTDEALTSEVAHTFRDKMPSAATLGKWMTSEQVGTILRLFVLEGEVGRSEVIRYSEVYRLLEEVRISRSALVSAFVRRPEAGCVAAIADRVLGACTSRDLGAPGAMTFRDLFRLLHSLGLSPRRFASCFGADEGRPPRRAVLGDHYHVLREIGEGFHGVCCYMAQDMRDSTRVAVKWPVGHSELRAMQDILGSARLDFPLLPRIHASGTHAGKPFVVTELLGSPISRVFDRLHEHPFPQRWRALCVIGRLLLRRLEAMHACGYVHCDISPENILLGPTRCARAGPGSGGADGGCPVTLYLIDFGLARKYPSAAGLPGDTGSAEWSSIRSAEGGRRLPEDDLQALGWTLLHGLYGSLPWYDWLSKAYGNWGCRVEREQVVKRVQVAKMRLLEQGWPSFKYLGAGWEKLEALPGELRAFIQTCVPPGPSPEHLSAWEVVGGAKSGGILVREGERLASPKLGERLSTGSRLAQLDLVGERLHYRLLSGYGPEEGWVNTTLNGRKLVQPASDGDLRPAYAGRPDYGDLLRLLGGPGDGPAPLSGAADAEDLGRYHEQVVPLL